MQQEEITIVLPTPNRVLSPNCMVGSIGGRMMKAAASKRYRGLARDAVDAENIQTGPWSHVSVNAEFRYPTKRRRDADNAKGSLKSAYDGIVDSGLVLDDDPEHMTRPEPTFSVDKLLPCVILTLRRLE